MLIWALLGSNGFLTLVAAARTMHANGLAGGLPLPAEPGARSLLGHGKPPLVCPLPVSQRPGTPPLPAVTTGFLKGIAAQWKPQHDPDLLNFVNDQGLVRKEIKWEKSGTPVWGKHKRALVGGLHGAREVVSFPLDFNGLGAAAASVAAQRPYHISQFIHHVGKPNSGMLSVTLRLNTDDEGFVPFTLNVRNTLPTNVTSHKIAGTARPSTSSWFTLVAKVVVQQQPPILSDAASILQGLSGHKTQMYWMNRYSDFGQAGCNNGTTVYTLDQILHQLLAPSETFDIKMGLLVGHKVGMINLNAGTNGLQYMAGYNAKTGRVELADHTLQTVHNAVQIRSRDGKTDVSVGPNYLSVVDVLKGPNGKAHALHLYNPDPASPPKVGSDFVLPIEWLRGLANSIVTYSPA